MAALFQHCLKGVMPELQGRGTGKSFAGATAYGSPVEVIKDKLYFHTIEGVPKSSSSTHLFCVDSQVQYESFYNDFGPLNEAVLFRYCERLKKKLSTTKKRLIHYTGLQPQKRANAAYLVGAFAVIHAGADPEDLWRRFAAAQTPPAFLPFRDAAMGPSTYDLGLKDVWKGVKVALRLGWLDFATFDVDEYEYYERVETGDFNWIVPDKFLAFCGPHAESVVENGYPYHAPEVYFDYFRSHNITTIIRLNKKVYDAARFTNAGFEHVDLYFVDGSTPSDNIVKQFLAAVDASPGACAVHCKAGLGRTGTLIGCWMMRDFGLTAAEVMAWCRIARPGSIIGPQQQWLMDKQEWCWSMGPFKGRKTALAAAQESPKNGHIRASANILSKSHKTLPKTGNGVGQMTTKLTDIRLSKDNRATQPDSSLVDESRLDAEGHSQGDRLLAIKAKKSASHAPPPAAYAPHPLSRRPIHETASSLAANPRFASPTTPIKPVTAMGARPKSRALPPATIPEETEPASPISSPAARRLHFPGGAGSGPAEPRTNSLPRKVPRVHEGRRTSVEKAEPSTSVGQPPKILRTRASMSRLPEKESAKLTTTKSKSSISQSSSRKRRSPAAPLSRATTTAALPPLSTRTSTYYLRGPKEEAPYSTSTPKSAASSTKGGLSKAKSAAALPRHSRKMLGQRGLRETRLSSSALRANV